MQEQHPFDLNRIAAFRAGFRSGQLNGKVSLDHARHTLTIQQIPVRDDTLRCFLNGNADGASNQDTEI